MAALTIVGSIVAIVVGLIAVARAFAAVSRAEANTLALEEQQRVIDALKDRLQVLEQRHGRDMRSILRWRQAVQALVKHAKLLDALLQTAGVANIPALPVDLGYLEEADRNE